MAHRKRLTVLIAAAAAWAAPAAAQFGGIFRDGPPRPPADVPVYRDERLPPDAPRNSPGYDPRRDAPQPPPPPLTRFPVPPGTRPGGIQTETLPPPPGTAPPQQANVPPPSGTPGQPPAVGSGQPPLTGLPPGQRQPRGTPGQPGDPAPGPAPSDEVVVAPPSQKIVNPTAVFAGLDKITGRIISFDVAIDETVQFGALRLTPRACYTRPPSDAPNTDGFIEVDEITLQGEVKRIFTGWMFAASPGLHGIEHPIYDVWLTDCRKESPAATGAQAAQQPATQPTGQPATQPQPSPPPPPGAGAPLRR